MNFRSHQNIEHFVQNFENYQFWWRFCNAFWGVLLYSKVSLNITNSYYNNFLCLISSKTISPKFKFPDILDVFWVIGFDLSEILNISLDFEYSRVLSLCSAPSCHHHKWSWMSIVSMFGSQDLPSTSVWHMWGGRLWWLLKLKFASLISLRTWEIDAGIDLSSLKVCAAKHDSDQKIHSLFESWSSDQVEIPRRVQDSWEERITCRDEDSGVEASVRKKVWGRNFVRLRLRLRLSRQNLLRSLRQREI